MKRRVGAVLVSNKRVISTGKSIRRPNEHRHMRTDG